MVELTVDGRWIDEAVPQNLEVVSNEVLIEGKI